MMWTTTTTLQSTKIATRSICTSSTRLTVMRGPMMTLWSRINNNSSITRMISSTAHPKSSHRSRFRWYQRRSDGICPILERSPWVSTKISISTIVCLPFNFWPSIFNLCSVLCTGMRRRLLWAEEFDPLTRRIGGRPARVLHLSNQTRASQKAEVKRFLSGSHLHQLLDKRASGSKQGHTAEDVRQRDEREEGRSSDSGRQHPCQ